MQEYIDFIGRNPLPFIGLVALIVVIAKVEISRVTSKYARVNVNQAVSLMNKDKSVILDVREDKERKNGMIENSQHIRLGELTEKMGQLGTNKQVPIIVYCKNGTRSGPACTMLTKAGFENVSSLTGGLIAWETANLPTVSS